MSNEIYIEVVKGGFVLNYPVLEAESDIQLRYEREVFVSPRKLHQRLKEVIDTLSLVSEDKPVKD